MMDERVPIELGPSDLREIGVIAAMFAVLPLLPLSRFQFRILTILLVFTLFAVGLNLIFGHTDQLFLFVGGLGAVGAYTTVILGNALEVTPWLTLPAGVAFAGLIGGLVSYIAARRNMTVILIAIFTFALQLAIIETLIGAQSVTGGTVGMTVERVSIESEYTFYYLFLVLLVGYLLIYAHLVNSRFGYATMAIRQDEVAASSLGVDPVRYKVIAGVIGAMMIGLVGALYGFWSGRILPSTYEFLTIDVLVLIMVTLGGLRTLAGPVVGAVLVMWIEEYLGPFINGVLPGGIRWRLVIFGVLLIVLYLHFRAGIVPKVKEYVGTRRIADPAREGG